MVVRFDYRLYPSCLIHVSDLILVDRSFQFGDVVKRRAGDAASGTIIRTAVECTLQSAVHRDAVKGTTSCFKFPSGPPSKATRRFAERDYVYGVPTEELQLDISGEGKFVILGDWVGTIEHVDEDVVMCLEDGSVVQVAEPLSLEIPISPAQVRKHFREERREEPVWARGGLHGRRTKPNMRAAYPDRLAPGTFVVSTRSNLRQGQWKFGAYNPAVRPQGYVLELVMAGMGIEWIFQNVLTPRGPVDQSPPPRYFDADRLRQSDITFYRRERIPASSPTDTVIPGYSVGTALETGDYVRFKNLEEAALKYDGKSKRPDGRDRGQVVAIPTTMSNGYDINAFRVVATHTKVTVQWQDLSVTTHDSTAVVPYLNVDDLDVWPGEVVTVKGPDPPNSSEVGASGDSARPDDDLPSKRQRRIGVVQTVDAGERVARLRWLGDETSGAVRNPNDPENQVPVLSETEEEVSLYEIIGAPGLTVRRGDFVSIEVHAYFDQAMRLQGGAAPPQPGLVEGDTSSATSFPVMVPTSVSAAVLPPEVNLTPLRIPSTSSAIDWFGEVVDLRLDGLVTVRLGALENVRDVLVPPHRVFIVYGADHPSAGLTDDGDETGSSEWMDVDDEEFEEEDVESEAGEEVLEGAGAHRPEGDDGDEMMWSTDDATSPVVRTESKDNHERAELRTSSNTPMRPSETAESARPESDSNAQPEAPPPNIAKYAILEGPPPADHAFLQNEVSFNPIQSRRIFKECHILKAALPDWVYVRTWESRLDLLRALIIGPLHTPYALAPFIVDIHFTATFPVDPPRAFFHSWTNRVGRINPNLYEDGNICLSILGTWPGDSKVEGWNPGRSTVLQILVSILGLVLVREPYFSKLKHFLFLPAFLCGVIPSHTPKLV